MTAYGEWLLDCREVTNGQDGAVGCQSLKANHRMGGEAPRARRGSAHAKRIFWLCESPWLLRGYSFRSSRRFTPIHGSPLPYKSQICVRPRPDAHSSAQEWNPSDCSDKAICAFVMMG